MKAKRAFQFLALSLALAGLATSVWLLTQKSSPLYQPIENYKLVAPLHQLSDDDVRKVISPYLGGSFWEIPLDKIQAEIIRMDWVESAEVKRKWPNLLYITINEQVPVARWNENGLINGSGEVFYPNDISGFNDFVKLEGQLEQSTQILTQLISLQKKLEPLGLIIENMALSEGVWYVTTLNGPKMIIDSNEYDAKVGRFIRAFPKLDKALRNSARHYDLRYSNGFIVSN